jgi:ppGpp synthetase/RelA/SpoT-type nucleotidyltranferase
MIAMDQEEAIKSALTAYNRNKFAIEQFWKAINSFFSDHPKLNTGSLPIIHSIKSRLKDSTHLEEKIRRKWDIYGSIDENNVFDFITDLAGVRILHLYQAQFIEIHNEIIHKIDDEDWFFGEPPKAYTWDPESHSFYNNLDIKCEIKDTYYTSVHYLIQPKKESLTSKNVI